MDEKQFKAHIIKIRDEVLQAVDSDIPMVAGKTAVDLFTENFQEGKEGFFGNRWAEVNRRKAGHYDKHGKYRKNYAKGVARTSPILTGVKYVNGQPVGSGELGRSINYDTDDKGGVTVFSDKDYASYHNEGTDTIPQRQFIGDSPVVEDAIIKEIERKLNVIFNS